MGRQACRSKNWVVVLKSLGSTAVDTKAQLAGKPQLRKSFALYTTLYREASPSRHLSSITWATPTTHSLHPVHSSSCRAHSIQTPKPHYVIKTLLRIAFALCTALHREATPSRHPSTLRGQTLTTHSLHPLHSSSQRPQCL